MTLLDYVLAVILGYCLVRGIFRGLVKELSSIVGVLAGFYFAFSYYAHLAGLLSEWLPNGGYANIIGFLILFVGIYLVISIMGALIKYMMNIASMGWFDRIGGMLVGGAKGVLILAVLVAMLTTFLPKSTTLIKESTMAPHVMGISAVMVRVVSTDIKALFDNHLKELKLTWDKRKSP
ncbi:MAG: CvpA family protein [Desulfatitalea sp.]|nr:CvpA family protein [Desulfatitalea sp.]